jgi:hypothetical protein
LVKGHKRLSGAGRKKGTPNRATKEWKAFVAALVSDPDNQKALKDAVKARPELLFKAAEFAHGKPHQSVDQEITGPIEIRWKGEEGT